MLPIRNLLRLEDNNRLKAKGWKKRYMADTNQKKV